MSCVSCEMSSVKELGWTSVREHESSSTKWHTKAALEWVELCKMSCERWVMWDELCDLWDERSCVSCKMSGVVWDEFCELWDEWSCVRWVVWVVIWVLWKNLGELQWENTKAAPPNGTRKQLLRCLKKRLEEESCYRDTMTKTHNKNVHRRPTVWRAQTTHFWRAQTNPEPTSSTFRSISGFALPSLIHNNQPLL